MTLIQKTWALTVLPAVTGICATLVLGALCLDIESQISQHSQRMLLAATYTRLTCLYTTEMETLLAWCYKGRQPQASKNIKLQQNTASNVLKKLLALSQGDKQLASHSKEVEAAHQSYVQSLITLIPASPTQRLILTAKEMDGFFGVYANTRAIYYRMIDILNAESQADLEAVQNKAANAAFIVSFCFVFNLIVVSALLYFFSRYVAIRIDSLERSAFALAQSQPASPLLAGHDEIMQLEAKLISLAKELELARARKQEFLTLVSHDLRSPLNSLEMSLELFGKGVYGDISVEGRRNFRMQSKKLERLITLISDLLDLEKIDANLFQTEKTINHISDLFKGLEAVISEGTMTDRITLTCQPCNVYCNSDQIVTSLLRISALCLYASKGAVTISAFPKGNEKAVILIEAHNPIERGLNRRDPFNRFAISENRGQSLTQEQRHGLALAKQLANLNGAQLDFSSESKLIRFTMTLATEHRSASEKES